ncbi:c-type heme family protein [Mangrovimonas spongiae]|uniref:DUF3365 domain-containing protein n=1 Tax=Mangrovimonas spongiae TaxID=2494697 RepID=A0A3R9NYE5_9FLAO|nr:DUF3365 domain-containing protein [Mangrovimonas spongiae]RSK40366.1 DUF3365 domain-containing protein [Mangrovimonas spongiae]
MKKIIILAFLSMVIFSCKNDTKTQVSALDKQLQAQSHPGKKLMETNCYTCHSPSASHEDRIGPPMIAIKKHYIDSNTSKEAFIKSMQEWIKNPTEDNAKMFGAVKRFGVMPKQHFPEETIRQIADYMYDFDIEQPEWFEDHFNEQKGQGKGARKGQGKGMQKKQVQTNDEALPYAERGLKYALSTKAVLGKNLMGTIQKQGTIEALAFCNEKAYPLTDSMSVVHNANIKRVSDKPRNQNNQANSEELDYIKTFKQVVASNEEPKPMVKKLDNKVQVYYPIVTNTMCLQCHGKPNETLAQSTFTKIKALYPSDKAIGYNANEVRGMWRVTFAK